MSNINSFAQNINKTVTLSANQLAMLTAMADSMVQTDTYVSYDYTDADGNSIKYQIPSYDSIVNRLKAVEESINSLSTGKGVINLTDGTRRELTLSSVPTPPAKITDLTDPTTFTVDAKWFFEDFMYPGAQVTVDLTDKIEASADRVKYVRVILNSNNPNSQTMWESDLALNKYDYASLLTLLRDNGIPYYLDDDVVDLPLVKNTLSGVFQITTDPIINGTEMWYQLDSITYSTISSDGINQGNNNILSEGDLLSYEDSIFKIIAINTNNMRVRLLKVSGVQMPGVYSTLRYYQDPFASKVVNVKFGANEYNIIYFKGITEAYNLEGETWSTPIRFASNDLILEGTSGLQQQQFLSYYNQYIMDWGAKMIAETKERKITAWAGQTPNSPTLNGDDFRVVQINTLINAAIDTTDVKNTGAEIESVKSQISSLKSTIAAQKSDLQSAVDETTYNSIQQQIASNTTDLDSLETNYSSLVISFLSIVKENSAILTEPKYHIRGFFPIPTFKYQDEDETVQEEIIGFDIAYRYIKEDNTSTQLNTFTYTNSDGTEITGTFTDWVIEQGPMKTKVYDDDLGRYVWKSENVADGTETNINQIDIAINKGEQVEIKVRSISECGYPENPLRSSWSNSVIISFPSTLATTNEIADLIKMVNDDATTITIKNTLNSLGVTTHLRDTVPNTNSVNGLYFVHTASNIAYEDVHVSSDGAKTINTISIQDKISEVFEDVDANTTRSKESAASLLELINRFNDLVETYGLDSAAVNSSISKLSEEVDSAHEKIDSVIDSENLVVTVKELRLKNNSGNERYALRIDNDQTMLADIENPDEKKLGTMSLKNFYIYPNGIMNPSETCIDISSYVSTTNVSINTLNTNTAALRDDVTSIQSTIVNIAYKNEVEAVQSNVDDLKTTVDTFYSDNTISCGEVLVGTTSKILLSGTAGKLEVVNKSTTEKVPVYAYDFIIENNNKSNKKVSLNTVNDTLDIISDNYVELSEQVETNKELLNQIVYTKGTNVQLRANDAEISGTITSNQLTNSRYVSGDDFFEPLQANNNSRYCQGKFNNIFLFPYDNNEYGDGWNLNVLEVLLKVSDLISSSDGINTSSGSGSGSGGSMTLNYVNLGSYKLDGAASISGDSGVGVIKGSGFDNLIAKTITLTSASPGAQTSEVNVLTRDDLYALLQMSSWFGTNKEALDNLIAASNGSGSGGSSGGSSGGGTA